MLVKLMTGTRMLVKLYTHVRSCTPCIFINILHVRVAKVDEGVST